MRLSSSRFFLVDLRHLAGGGERRPPSLRARSNGAARRRRPPCRPSRTGRGRPSASRSKASTRWPRGLGTAEGVGQQSPGEAPAPLRLLDGHLLDVPQLAGEEDEGRAHDLVVRVGDDPEVPGLETRATHDLGGKVLERLSVPIGPLEEGVFDDRPGRPVIVLGGGPDGVAAGKGLVLDLATVGEGEDPARPTDVVAEGLEETIAGAALRDGHPDPDGSGGPGPVLHPQREARTQPLPAVIGVDGGVPSVAPAELAVGDQGLAGEHPQRVGCDGEAGPLPVAEDVLLLDPDLPGVVQLLRRHHLEHGVGVGQGQWPSGQTVGKGDRPVVHGISEPHGAVGISGIVATGARPMPESRPRAPVPSGVVYEVLIIVALVGLLLWLPYKLRQRRGR